MRVRSGAEEMEEGLWMTSWLEMGGERERGLPGRHARLK